MNVFLDANVIIAILNKEYPVFPSAARIMSLHGHQNFRVFTSPLCLAIGFYFAEKKSGRISAMKKMEIMSKNLSIAGHLKEDVMKIFQNRKITDFEDGLQYYAAIENKCHCIVTEDVGDYYFSEIEVVKPRDFFKLYLEN